MFRNYLKTAFRHLWRNKGFTAIHIFGLAIGLATCLLIALFVRDELDFDRYNQNASRIFRIDADFLANGNAFNDRVTPAQLGAVLKKDYPQVEQTVRLNDQGDVLVKKGTETLIEHYAVTADSTLFQVFTLPMITGNPQTALVQPDGLVLSESMALKYFNTTAVLGKTLLLNNTTLYQVTGVIKDMPAQSHIHFNLIRSMSGDENSRNTNWMNDNYVTYVLTRPGVTEQALDGYLQAITRKYMEASLVNLVSSTLDELEKKGEHFRYKSIPLTKIHLFSTLPTEAEPGGNIQYIYLFIVIAVFILLMACINFMNLSTACAAGRSKEVGVRKVLGSNRYHLLAQFFTESLLTSSIAMVLAILLALLAIPYLSIITGKHLTTNAALLRWLAPFALLITVVVGLLAGSYPAFFLSAFEPVKVLKGRLANGFKNSWLRNSLVVFQFVTAVVLIAGTLVIYCQLNFIRNKKLGYNREQVLVLQNAASLGTHLQTFKNSLLQVPGITNATITASLPTNSEWETSIFSRDAARSSGQVTGIGTWNIDPDYLSTMGMSLAAGRNFSATQPTDSSCILINETAAKLLGFKNPLQAKLYASNNGRTPLNIIGVVKDFHTGSLHHKIPPLVFTLYARRDYIAFRVHTHHLPALIAQVEQRYHAIDKMAGQPFLYTFLDDHFNQLYQSEQRTGTLFIYFTVFAVLIACLGLFGLVTYAAEQRRREIGIRKVLGASVTGIITLLSGDFFRLVLAGNLIAVPVAWWMMHRWLQDFAYRTPINWWVFAAAGLLALLLTLVTVCFRAFTAALANPVNSLRAE